MVSVCFYFQVHQPYRLKKYKIFDAGDPNYFDEEKNKEILHKVAHKSYLPTNALLLQLLKKHPEFKISFSFSGVFLEQCEEYYPEVIESFKELVATGRVEVLAETYYHSLASIFSRDEFIEQVKLHEEKVFEHFNVKPKIFRNTELIYRNDLAKTIHELGYRGIVIEGWDHYLGWRSPNFTYQALGTDIPLLLKNYKLSDDIAFRFSNKAWKEHPLSVEKFSSWVNSVNGNGNSINLFMDYETFGEHQWEDTGIFQFLSLLPAELLKHPDNNFKTPTEVAKFPTVGELDVPHLLSWADMERDVSAWLGNPLQDSSIQKLYELESEIKESGDKKLLDDWRKLTTSDHFYYMCTKYFSDGDVHKYFSPYESPYDAFIYFMMVYKDLKQRVNDLKIQAH